MSQIKQINDPSSGVDSQFIEAVNTSGGALSHGQVVVHDLATAAKGLYSAVTTTTTAIDQHVAGVVYDPQGFGVANGDRCTIMTRGLHSAVVVQSGQTTAIGAVMVTDASAGRAIGNTANLVVASVGASIVTPGSMIGFAAIAITSGTTASAVRVKVL